MIKPKYPKQADISQIARLAVERAIGDTLTKRKAETRKPKKEKPQK